MRKLLHGEILEQRLTTEQAKSVTRHSVSVLLTNVRSLYNVGSIFRTCDSARVSELILCGFTPHPPRKEIEKTALGAVDTVPWRYFKHAHEAIETIRAEGNTIFAVEIAENSRTYTSLNAADFPCCLVLGNELTGIDDDVMSRCDSALEIPMFGVKHSLNVAVAAGIVIFESVNAFHRSV